MLRDQTSRFIDELKRLQDENADLKTRITALEQRCDSRKPDSDPIDALIEALKERENRKLKEPNLVIYGMTEQATPEQDREIVDQIFEKAHADSSKIVKTFRMRKNPNDTRNFPGLLKVITTSTTDKEKVMAAQKPIIRDLPMEFLPNAGYSRYFRDDLTPIQRRTHGKLVEDRNKRNLTVSSDHPGKKWCVFKGKVVLRDEKPFQRA